ncbi:MAG: FAD-dependent oxidoreductase, partial [Lachnospiraceae bacterium]|nr:FAD-dependent oxidoreductase [Lachnospiraceae bacterium]
NLVEKGIKVTLVERLDQLLNTFDYDMACFAHAKLREKGVDLLLGSNVTGFKEEKGQITTIIDDAAGISADMVLLAIGVAPENDLAVKAGLETGVRGTIRVNDRMETSVPDIYAVGDAVQVKNFVTGEDAAIALAGPANKQGRIAADNICGKDSHYRASLGSSVLKIFDLTAASTGLTEKAAKAAGLNFESVVLAPSSHAGYYPGAKVMTFKVVYERGTRRILGGQIIGSEGVDKRIDVLATAIWAGVKADRLKELDLSYAPPFSSAKDPVNMAGFMIENIEDGLVKQFHWYDLPNLPEDGSVTYLDVRTPGECSKGKIDDRFINIPVDELRDRLGELDPSKSVYVNCQSALRSYIACRILSQNGFDCYNFSGGYRFFAAIFSDKKIRDQAFPCGMEK